MRLITRCLGLAAAAATVLALTARAAGTQGISGRIADRNGMPRAGALVELHDAEGRLLAQGQAGEHGRYAVEVGAPGTYRLLVRAADGARAEREVVVAASECREIDLLLVASPSGNGGAGQSTLEALRAIQGQLEPRLREEQELLRAA